MNVSRKRAAHLAIAVLAAFLFGLVLAAALTRRGDERLIGGRLEQLQVGLTLFNQRLNRQPDPLPIADLRRIIGSEASQADALRRIQVYYLTNRSMLQAAFNETNDLRLRALFGMYIIHTAVPYGENPVYPTTLTEFVNMPFAHCGTMEKVQEMVYTALGLTWRAWTLNGGDHGFLDVQIGDHWESFDPTTNVWISVGVPELVTGADRAWREFYMPALDPRADPRWREYEGGTSAIVIRVYEVEYGQGVPIGAWEQLAASAQPE